MDIAGSSGALPSHGPSFVERWYVLVVMCLIYALNIADRYVVSTVLEPIRLELQLTDSGVAFLTGVPLAFFYCSFGLLVAWVADRSNRRNILATCLILWSGFTAICGLSQRYWHLLLARIGVGVGEAGGTPTASAIVADYFVADRRPMAFTVIALGAPIGAWLGADLAGLTAHLYGWRAAFLVLGIPGVLLGLLVFATIREPVRGRLDAAGHQEKPSLMDSTRLIWRQKAAFHVIMGSGVSSLWGWGLIWWTPTFLMRSYDLNVGEAGAVTGRIHLVGGSLAIIGAAWAFSRKSMADPRRVLWVLAAGIGLTTIPSFVAYWTSSLDLAKLMFWLYIPAIYFFIGPCMGLLQNLTPPPMRAMVFAWSGLCGNVFNLIVAPQGVGFLSDWFAGTRGADASSLRWALLVLAPTGFWATYHFYAATKTIIEDQVRAIGYRDKRVDATACVKAPLKVPL
jgi:MFS family permease